MADSSFNDARDPARMVGQAITDISDKVSLLIHEEIELAKAEVASKISRLIRGVVVGLSAGLFVLLAVIALVNSGAWGIYELGLDIWLGYLIAAGALLLFAALGGLIALRLFKDPSPVPEMAIEEAKKTKDMIGQAANE